LQNLRVRYITLAQFYYLYDDADDANEEGDSDGTDDGSANQSEDSDGMDGGGAEELEEKGDEEMGKRSIVR